MAVFILMLCLVVTGLSLPFDENNTRDRREVTHCQPPANLHVLFERLNQHITASMYLQLGTSINQEPYMPTELNTHIAFDSQDTTCPTSVSNDPEASVNSRSICPWWYNVTQLPAGHYPAVIPQAVCKCADCVGNTVNECSRISTNIRVLRSVGCQDGFLKYQPVLMTHHVGCTCTKKRVSQDDNCGGWGCSE